MNPGETAVRGIEHALRERGAVVFVPTGNSMLPLLRPDRDSVVVEKRAVYRLFDIVLYRRASGDYVLHRIMGQDQNGFVLCGDNQFRKEYGVAPEQVLGAVREWSHNGTVRTPERFPARIYVLFWCRLFPLRRPVFFLKRCLAWLKRNITGNNRH